MNLLNEGFRVYMDSLGVVMCIWAKPGYHFNPEGVEGGVEFISGSLRVLGIHLIIDIWHFVRAEYWSGFIFLEVEKSRICYWLVSRIKKRSYFRSVNQEFCFFPTEWQDNVPPSNSSPTIHLERYWEPYIWEKEKTLQYCLCKFQVCLYLRESEIDISFRWFHREPNLIILINYSRKNP